MEEELIQRAKQGDNLAFTELIINTESELYKIARTRFECIDDINDVIQETIIQAFKSIKKLKEIKFFKTWIIKILINKSNKLYSKRKKDILVEYNEKIADTYCDNIEDVINEIDFELLINNLNYDEKIAVTLFYLEELSSKEISNILGVPESTIRNRISRARQKLKLKLKGEIRNG